MPDPQIQYFDVTGPGTQGQPGYGLLAQLGNAGGPVITAARSSPLAAWSWGDLVVGDYRVRCLAIASKSSQISMFKWYMNDWSARVSGQGSDTDFFAAGAPWTLRYKLSPTWFNIDDTALNGGLRTQIDGGAANGWIDLPHSTDGVTGATPSIDLSAWLAANDGNDGSRNEQVQHVTDTDLWVMNAFLYLAVKPASAAPAGYYDQFSWQLRYYYP